MGELKKNHVKMLFGDYTNNVAEIFVGIIKAKFNEKYDLNFRISNSSEELLEFAKTGEFDISILILNNILFHSGYRDEINIMNDSVQLITQITKETKRPVIAMSGLDDDSFGERAIVAGANFYFFVIHKKEDFIGAIEKCLDTMPICF
jgi:hypothetical protein